jgi:hypothetical protein
MALGRLNRPGLMVYGGTIRPGSCEGQPKLDIISAFQSYGRYLDEGQTEEAEKIRQATVRHSCPGAGACGGRSCYPSLVSKHVANRIENRHVHSVRQSFPHVCTLRAYVSFTGTRWRVQPRSLE